MPTPTEHKTVQPPSPSELRRSGARILAYAEAIHLRHGYGGQVGWTIVSRAESKEARIGQWQRLPSSTLGKRDFYFPTLCYSHS
jgi:hypothetical protein